MSNISGEYLKRRWEERNAPVSGPSPLGKILGWLIFLLFVAGAGWWGYHEVLLKYRLPQDRVLHDVTGRAINARIEGRDGDILKYSVLDDNTIRYLPITQLTVADREFVGKLPSALDISFPFDYLLPGDGGKERRVRLEARSEDLLKYTDLTDGTVHYVPLSSLPITEQELVRLKPARLDFSYPVDYQFSGQDPRGRVQWLGRSPVVAKYMTLQDRVVHYALIAELPGVEQAFVQRLPDRLKFDYPLSYALHAKDGKVLATQIDGRTEQVVKTGMNAERVDRYIPIEDIAEADQRFVRAMPSTLRLLFPFDATMAMADGTMQSMRIEGRTSELVRAAVLPNGVSDLYPLTAFSSADQRIIQMGPARLSVRFPFDYMLKDDAGKQYQARIVGRSPVAVQFTMADGKTYALALAKLTSMSRAVLQTLPANLAEIEIAAPVGNGLMSVRPELMAAVRALQQQVSLRLPGLAAIAERFNEKGLTPLGREAIEMQLNQARKELEAVYVRIEQIKGAGARPGDPPEVAKMRTRIDILIKDNASYERQTQDTKLLPVQQRAAQVNMNRCLQEEESLIRQIISAIGQDKL